MLVGVNRKTPHFLPCQPRAQARTHTHFWPRFDREEEEKEEEEEEEEEEEKETEGVKRNFIFFFPVRCITKKKIISL